MRRLGVMARAPSAAGKTRLTGGLAADAAASLREALLLDTLQAASATGVPVTVFFTPGDAHEEMRALVGPEAWLATQVPGDLGSRMRAAFQALFAEGARHVVLIGSDLPSLPPRQVERAFLRLHNGDDVVLGPAEDGGYYLIGLSAPVDAVFEGIAWGGPAVLGQTLERAAEAGLRASVVDTWYDVDVAADLRRVVSGEAPAVRTRAWVAARAGSGAATSRVVP